MVWFIQTQLLMIFSEVDEKRPIFFRQSDDNQNEISFARWMNVGFLTDGEYQFKWLGFELFCLHARDISIFICL